MPNLNTDKLKLSSSNKSYLQLETKQYRQWLCQKDFYFNTLLHVCEEVEKRVLDDIGLSYIKVYRKLIT